MPLINQMPNIVRDAEFIPSVAEGAYGRLCLGLARLVRRLSATPPRTQDSNGRVASPCPAGTFTRQEMPSLARRDNAELSGVALAESVGALG